MTRVLLCLLLVASALPSFACEYPSQVVNIPNGDEASQEDMLAAQADVKRYMAEMQTYLECMDALAASGGEEVSDRERQIHLERHNAAVEAMEIVAERFNAQVRLFSAANK